MVPCFVQPAGRTRALFPLQMGCFRVSFAAFSVLKEKSLNLTELSVCISMPHTSYDGELLQEHKVMHAWWNNTPYKVPPNIPKASDTPKPYALESMLFTVSSRRLMNHVTEQRTAVSQA